MAGYCCYAMQGITNDCGSNIGGIVRAWGACHSEAGKSNVVDNVIPALANPTNEVWNLFEFQKQTGSMTSTSSDNTAATAKLWTTAIVFQFERLETAKRLEINAMALGVTDWIIEDNNGRYWYVGYDFGANLSEGTAETGTAYEDFNGYNITLTAVEKQQPYEVLAEAMAPLLNETEEQ